MDSTVLTQQEHCWWALCWELTAEPSPGPLLYLVSFWKAKMLGILQTQSCWGRPCCHVEKVCLRTAQMKNKARGGEKWVKLSVPLRWNREAEELVVKSSRSGVLPPWLSSNLGSALTSHLTSRKSMSPSFGSISCRMWMMMVPAFTWLLGELTGITFVMSLAKCRAQHKPSANDCYIKLRRTWSPSPQTLPPALLLKGLSDLPIQVRLHWKPCNVQQKIFYVRSLLMNTFLFHL